MLGKQAKKKFKDVFMSSLDESKKGFMSIPKKLGKEMKQSYNSGKGTPAKMMAGFLKGKAKGMRFGN